MSEIYAATGSGNGFISHCSRSSVKKLECPVDTISTEEKGAGFQIHREIPNVMNKEFPQSHHSATMCSLSAANAKFCLDFFRELNKRKRNENIFFSPLSLSAAFGMVVLGARGSTLEQIEKVFHFREVLSSTRQENRYPSEQCEEDEGVHSQFQALLAEVSEPGPGCCLTIANRLFGEITYPFFQQYLDSTKKFYRAELEPVNFKYTEEEVRDKINFWVENETKGKIKDLFAAGFIDPSTLLVLVNAIYFKGKWAVEFKKENTKEAYFHLNKNERRKVQMMFQEGYFNMAIIEELKTKVIELQYFNNELSMFILLPEDDCEDFTGLEQLECALTYEKLAEWTSSATMQPLRVKVYLPQFKMEESYVLNSTLQEMGVMNVFDWGKADLSGISMKGGLVVSKAIQKTIVEVNEEGTEAGCSMGLLAMPLCCPVTCEFRADRPFLFFIRHNQTNTILFFGRYSSP